MDWLKRLLGIDDSSNQSSSGITKRNTTVTAPRQYEGPSAVAPSVGGVTLTQRPANAQASTVQPAVSQTPAYMTRTTPAGGRTNYYDWVDLGRYQLTAAAAQRDWADAQAQYDSNVSQVNAGLDKLLYQRELQRDQALPELLSQLAARNLTRSGIRARQQSDFEVGFQNQLDADRSAAAERLAAAVAQRAAIKRQLDAALEAADWAAKQRAMLNASGLGGMV